MMTLVEKGDNYRIFKDKILGIVPYYCLEDTSNATQKGGVWHGVKHTNYYFKTLKQIKRNIE
tara:strand:- start:28 stop:213 length:186 start_codon:yes stop_codon:yes gene_type:complete